MTTLLLEYKPPKFVSDLPIMSAPLWYHKMGLMQTSTGYGSKLVTSKKVYYSGKWRRLYCCCYSNSGTCYVIVKGKKVSFL